MSRVRASSSAPRSIATLIELDDQDGYVYEPTATVTDEQIEAVAATAAPYSLVQLRWASGRHQDGADAIEREHQRRMVSMRADGVIAILCPVLTDDLCGVAIMTRPLEEAEAIMAADPCVQAGMMTCEVVPCVGFPGDSLPG